MSFHKQAKEFFTEAYQAAIDAVSPKAAIRSVMQVTDDSIDFGTVQFKLNELNRVWVVGFGKASATMAQVVEQIAGHLIEDGVVVTKHQHSVPLQKIRVHEASHPVPDEAGVMATNQVIQLLQQTSPNDLVIVLISGGGSALLVHPRQGITLQDKQFITDWMLHSGVPIEKMNIVRKHLSAVKGGQLARLAAPAKVVSLILSDVIGDGLESIASGPTSPDPSTFADAKKILHEYDIWNQLKSELQQRFDDQMKKAEAETPKPGDKLFDRVYNQVIANNQKALLAVRHVADLRGYHSLILSSSVQGEAKEIARFYGAVAKEIRRNGQPISPPACIITGGETTVTVKGKGKGGRNMEMVLAILPDLLNLDNTAFFSAGTDGTDGPTDAAGAFGFSDSLHRGANLGYYQDSYLRNNDSYSYFSALSDLFQPGASGTNVMDVQILLIV